MRVEVASSLDDLERLAPAWTGLCDRADAPVLTRPFWCIPWARHLNGWRAYVVTVRRNDRLVGLAPFQARSLGGVEVFRFLGHGLGTVSAVVAEDDDAAEAAWGSALGGRRRFAQLIEYRGPRPRGLAGRPSRVEDHEHCVTVDCSVPFAEYMQARTKKLRENLRRAERAVAARGGFHVELVTAMERWREVQAEVLGIYDAAETAKPRQHLLRGVFGAFTTAMIDRAASEGILRLHLGRVGGRPAAFGVAFAAGGAHHYWLTRFHPDDADESVGVLLQREVISRGFDEGAQRVDLMLGDQPHKRRWTTGSYGTVNVYAASSRTLLSAGKAALDGVVLARRGHRSGGLEPPVLTT